MFNRPINLIAVCLFGIIACFATPSFAAPDLASTMEIRCPSEDIQPAGDFIINLDTFAVSFEPDHHGRNDDDHVFAFDTLNIQPDSCPNCYSILISNNSSMLTVHLSDGIKHYHITVDRWINDQSYVHYVPNTVCYDSLNLLLK